MLFHNRLTKHALKLLPRISLRDVVLARYKYLIVTSDAFLYCVCKKISTVLQLLWKKIHWPCVNVLSLQNPPLIIIG